MQEHRPNGEQSGFAAFLRKNALLGVVLICTAAVGVTALGFSKTWKQTKALTEDGLLSALTEVIQEESGTAEQPVQKSVQEPVREAVKETVSPILTELQPAASAPAAEAEPEVREVMAQSFRMPINGSVERDHSPDRLQYDRTMADYRTHDGLDIAAALGEQVAAVADGSVEQVYEDERLGVSVVLYHGGGLRSIYANLAGTPTVQPGDEVTEGQIIGAVGNTALFEQGDVTHLHFAMTQNGVSVDPKEYLD